MAARLNERFRWTVGQAPALGNAICMNYSRRFFSTLRGRTRANRRQHSIIPFVLALNEIVRISWIVCSIVIAGSPRIHYLRSPRFCSPYVRTTPSSSSFSFFILFYYTRIDVNRLEGIFTIDGGRARIRKRIYESDLLVLFSRGESSVFHDPARMEIWTRRYVLDIKFLTSVRDIAGIYFLLNLNEFYCMSDTLNQTFLSFRNKNLKPIIIDRVNKNDD